MKELGLFLSFRIFVFHEFGVFNEELKEKKTSFITVFTRLNEHKVIILKFNKNEITT